MDAKHFIEPADLGKAVELANLIVESSSHVVKWIQEMLGPRAEGEFEPWTALAPTLQPLLRDEVAGVFFPWSTANAKALAAGEKQFTVTLGGKPFTQETQKYHAKSLAALTARYAAVADKSGLDPILRETGWLRLAATLECGAGSRLGVGAVAAFPSLSHPPKSRGPAPKEAALPDPAGPGLALMYAGG
jgi:hypothetical protein